MSVAGANGVRFTATIAANIPGPANYILMGCWYKKNATDPGSIDYLAQWLTASENSKLILKVGNSSGYKLGTVALWRASGGSDAGNQQSSALTQDVWRLGLAYLNPDGASGAFIGLGNIDNGTAVSSTFPTTDTASQGLTALTLGDGGGLSSLTFFNGDHCEHFGFICVDATQRAAIAAALLTKTAAVVAAEFPTATLVYYYPMVSDTTAVAGPALTTVGSPSWDAGDHPSLISDLPASGKRRMEMYNYMLPRVAANNPIVEFHVIEEDGVTPALGIDHETTDLKISYRRELDDAPLSFDEGDGDLETIATIGSYVAPTSGKVRVKNIDDTAEPGDVQVMLPQAAVDAADGSRFCKVTLVAPGCLPAHAFIPLVLDVVKEDGVDVRPSSLTGLSSSEQVSAIAGRLPATLGADGSMKSTLMGVKEQAWSGAAEKPYDVAT